MSADPYADAIAEAAHLAKNLARNCGYSVFPCRSDNKRPMCPHGFLDASNDPIEISRLWQRYPGGLIGIATGAMSGIDVLDIDPHDLALKWFAGASKHIPSTRIYRTRRGGLHLFFKHAAGVHNSGSQLAKGVDVRGDGGYAIHWFAAGFPCENPDPPADWPQWLLEILTWQPESPGAATAHRKTSVHADKAVEGILRVVSGAAEGTRNAVLFWGACRLRERVQAGEIGGTEATALLIAAARAAGLPEPEARRTVTSAWRAV